MLVPPRTQRRTRRNWQLAEMNTWKPRRRKRRQSGRRLRRRLAYHKNHSTEHNFYLSFSRERKRRESGSTSVKRLLERRDLWRKAFSNHQRRPMERWERGSLKKSFEPKYLWRGYLIMWSSRQVSNAMDEEENGYGQMFCAPNHATTTKLILCWQKT